MELQVVDRHQETRDIVSFTLAGTDCGRLPAWAPGAHIDVRLPTGLIRQYSLNGPLDGAEWRISVLRERDSRGGSAFLHQAVKAGDRLQVSAPRNNFRLEHARHYVFVAGGIGITPLLPMIGSVAAAGAEWRLVYGGRSRDTMAFADELVRRYGGRVELVPQDERGLIDLASTVGDPDPGTLVYVCGPEGLIAAVETVTAHWPADSVHSERFVARGAAQSRGALDESFVVALRDGREVAVLAGVSVLQSLRDAGMDLDSSCEAGTCGTCEVAVLGGVPDHRDDVLTDDEKSLNDAMMICVSRSLTPVLELDL